MNIYDKIEMALENLNRANEEFAKNPSALNKKAVDDAAKWLQILEEKAAE